jgi:hypothetical protein
MEGESLAGNEAPANWRTTKFYPRTDQGINRKNKKEKATETSRLNF